MKHLIETTNLSSLGNAKYDRLILDSTKNEIVYRGGVNTNGHSYVDLGLPSGTLWAKCNIGAEKETDYGDYFMWGSTTPNTADECDWTKAPFNGGSSYFNSKYFNAHKSEWLDSKDNLKSEFDAARAIMGGDWRMPTKDEFQELIDYTTHSWVENFKGTGVNGRNFTGSNGNSIFIPASGYCYNGSVGSVDYNGYIWSSSLYASRTDSAWCLNFYSLSCYISYGSYRCNGQSVRGVCK